MKSFFVSVALFVAAALADTPFSISTPGNVVECEPTQLKWQGGVPPFYLSILPGNSPNGAAIESLPAVNASSLTWICNIQANTNIGFTLRDSTGAITQTASLTITAGVSSSCLDTTSVIPGPTAGASTAGASSGATTGTSATSSPSATGKSGAPPNVAQFGAAGIVGAAVAAILL